ncbi:XAP5 protein [Heterostelium album PN500]|uniref:XAP5 protein n=1 Tax=Heterostelium pallidum (strain ATCC 26659 / Pp 5 / PN500) TaxID=670386 RepID=D3B8S5_HETP5|nr:XAP5 protein [Heterostelium album PN500]EFA82443.1 XAP5 protein [Heterostelium album PN500]|eukprot:XP_020434560.1 XAP5 protein [Heterostelium album PN500]
MAEYKGGSGDGMRIRMMEKQRENEQRELNKLKEKIKEDNKTSVVNINQKFESANDTSNAFKNVGLVSMSEFTSNLKGNDLQQQQQQLQDDNKKRSSSSNSTIQSKKKKQKKVTKNKLSFDVEDDEEDQEQDKEDNKNNDKNNNDDDNSVSNVNNNSSNKNNNKFKLGKDPTVNTEFLPDKEREEQERMEREKLAKQWIEDQDKIKAEVVEITYSYWDGSGHRRVLQCTKGTTIDKFLEMARQEFKELRGVSVDHLLFIKEDLIIPHNYSFYDLIIEKARGKSGPLFKFDVHDDVRLVSDATVEKDETHAGKVVEKSWYEKNKHIFPASRWEVYDPTVARDKYTISDKLSKH